MINNLIPNPNTIQVAWFYFQTLLLITFPIHILFMNASLGSAGIATYLHFKGGEKEKKLAYRLAVFLPLTIAFAVNFGVAPLLFVQVLYGQFIYTSSVLMAFFWILIIPILIAAYYLAYYYDFGFEKLGNAGKWVIGLSFVLFIVIAYFFTNNMLLMVLPEKFADWFQNMGGTILASSHRSFLPRFLHNIFGAIAIGGLYTAIVGGLKGEKDKELAEYSKTLGLKIYWVFTFVNFVIGFWYLAALPKEVIKMFMGVNQLATVVFAFSLISGVASVMFAVKNDLTNTVITAVLTVVLMTFVRAYARTGFLKDYFKLSDLKVVPEYSTLIFFLVIFVIGIATVYWMIKKAIEAFN